MPTGARRTRCRSSTPTSASSSRPTRSAPGSGGWHRDRPRPGTATATRKSSTSCSRDSGRVRVDDELLTLEPLDSLLVEPAATRQLFNDTDADQLWLVVGAPPEAANTLEMSEETLREIYPDGPKALPPELGG